MNTGEEKDAKQAIQEYAVTAQTKTWSMKRIQRPWVPVTDTDRLKDRE